MYRVAEKTPAVEKAQGGGLYRQADSGLVKQEPVDWCESENLAVEVALEVVIGRPADAAAALPYGVGTRVLFPPRGVQPGYSCFPGMEPGAKAWELLKPGGMSLQQVKVELFSPGSCVTNDSAFCEASGTGDGEVASSAWVDVEAKCGGAESVLMFPSGKESVAERQVTCVIKGDASQVAAVCVSPLKSLRTALVMIPDDAIVEQIKQPLTPASSDGSTVEVPTAVIVTAGSLPSVQKVLGPAKVEVVECRDKLVTALDYSGGGRGGGGPCGETEAHSRSGKAEVAPPDAAREKLMTALEVFPTEAHKFEVMEHSQVDVGCEGMSLVPTAKSIKAAAPLKSVLVHVKSEPVDNSGEIGAGSSVKELERVVLQNEMSRIPRNAVKQEMLNSTPKYPSGVFTRRKEHQASEKSSENDHSSSGSQNADEMEEVCLPTQVHNVAADIIGMLSRSSQKRSRAQETLKEKEIKNRNSNPGRRIQGGRIYDSALGKTCHWCRQKTVEHHVKCRECTVYYCGPCLMNRNGENIMEELAEGVRWLCPKCRNGCGPGCDNCCNCGPCRKAGGKAPTGQLIREARNAGFLNAHDYLVHLETGETPEEVARRKVGRDWTNCGRFEWKDASEDSEERDEPSSSEGADEFTLNEETSTQLHEGKIGMKVVKKFLQSQKRKRGAMRDDLAVKWNQVEVSPSVGRRDVDSILARLKVPQELNLKETQNEVEAVSLRVEQIFKEDSALRVIQGDLALRNQDSGMRTCKQEYVEANAGNNVGGSDVEDMAAAKRIKIEGYSGEEHHALLSEFIMSPRSSLLGPFAGVKCKVEPTTLSEDYLSVVGVDNSNEAGPGRKFTSDADKPGGQARPSKDSVSESELTLKMRRASVLSGGAKTGLNSAASQLMFEQRSLECPSDPQGTEYRMKLKYALAQPFDAKELEMLEESAKCRKPVQKIRQMRGRIVDVVTEDEGFSYLDHHRDFASKLEEAQSPALKLALLRGFFFWLQHSCMEGAFRPWPGALTGSRPQSGDCIETEGPDCQVTAVVLQLDEGKDALQPDESSEAHRCLKRKFTEMVQRPRESTNGVCETDTTSNFLKFSTSRQALIPFPAKKNSVQQVKLPKMKGQVTVQPGINYRVVLCLPAPALCKK